MSVLIEAPTVEQQPEALGLAAGLESRCLLGHHSVRFPCLAWPRFESGSLKTQNTIQHKPHGLLSISTMDSKTIVSVGSLLFLYRAW